MLHNATRINNPYAYFKYFVLILPFLLLSCGSTDPVSPPDTETYTVTFETNEGSEIPSQTIDKGGKAVKPANDPTKDNQSFLGWYATADGTGDAFDFDTLVTKDLTLYAIWGYEVVFETNGGSDIMSQIVVKGEKVVKPANDPTKGTQSFLGWYATATGTGDAFDFDTLVTKDLTLYAIWGYEVVFETNGGSDIMSQIVVKGEKVVKPANDPTKGTQSFLGWYATATGTGDAFDFDTLVTKDLTLYAIWGYEVVFETNGGDSVPNQTIKEEGKTTFVGANQADKAFVWWYTSPTFEVSTRYDFDKVVTGDITLYAKWEDASKYTLNKTVNNDRDINKITHIDDASDIVEIPYSIEGSPVTGVEGEESKNIFVSAERESNRTVTQVILPNGIEVIFKYAFSDCEALASITIPNSVKHIGSSAFFGCSSLESITIPNSLITIQKSAFEASALKSITIPNNVTRIENNVFSNCSALTSVILSDNTDVIRRDTFSRCIALTTITIPNKVTKIEGYVFDGCTSLRSIIIPSSVTNIEEGAFSSCTSLASVRVEATTPPTLNSNDVFNDTSDNLSITVPTASVTAYKTAEYWNPYADRIIGY